MPLPVLLRNESLFATALALTFALTCLAANVRGSTAVPLDSASMRAYDMSALRAGPKGAGQKGSKPPKRRVCIFTLTVPRALAAAGDARVTERAAAAACSVAQQRTGAAAPAGRLCLVPAAGCAVERAGLPRNRPTGPKPRLQVARRRARRGGCTVELRRAGIVPGFCCGRAAFPRGPMKRLALAQFFLL